MNLYRVTFSGVPERSGEVNDRIVYFGSIEVVPEWEVLRENGEIPDHHEWYGSQDFETEAEARAFAEYRAGGSTYIEMTQS